MTTATVEHRERELRHFHSTGVDAGEPRRKSSVFRRALTSRFLIEKSTDDHHKANQGDLSFYGPFAHIRKTLDYSYHTHYRKERQWLQDSIIEDFLDNMQNGGEDMTPEEPWFVYTCGAPGAGKRHTLMKLCQEGKLPLLSFVHADKTEIRRRLPEYASYAEKSPDHVDELTGKEAGQIMEILVLAALELGRNVVLDGSLFHVDWYTGFFQQLRRRHPTLKLALLHISSPHDMILQHALEVALWTRKTLTVETIDLILEQIPISIEKILPQMNYYCELHNGRNGIEIIDEEWTNFTKTFVQKAARMEETEESKRMVEAAVKAVCKRYMSKVCEKKKLFVPRISSEEYYKAAVDERGFFGPYAKVRSTLDYTYHEHYNKKRQSLQDKIILDMLNAALITDKDGNVCTTPTEPWIVFTAGAMGAGKSYTMNRLVERGRFPLLAFVIVDPDEIRRHLPEFHVYVEESPELAGELTRKESGFIAEILTLVAMKQGMNVLVDGSLRDAEWYKTYFVRLRNDYPTYRQAIIHVTAPRDAIFQRAASRALATGRVVPREVLEKALDQVPHSVKMLSPLVDYFCEINNPPGADDVELIQGDPSWEVFEGRWVQTCAWIPNRRQFLLNSQTIDERLTFSRRKER